MIVRGAWRLVFAAYGIYLGRGNQTQDRNEFLTQEEVAQLLRSTRPTAVNCFWAISRMLKTAYETIASVEQLKQVLLKTAQMINAEVCNLSSNRRSWSGSLTIPSKLSIQLTAMLVPWQLATVPL